MTGMPVSLLVSPSEKTIVSAESGRANRLSDAKTIDAMSSMWVTGGGGAGPWLLPYADPPPPPPPAADAADPPLPPPPLLLLLPYIDAVEGDEDNGRDERDPSVGEDKALLLLLLLLLPKNAPLPLGLKPLVLVLVLVLVLWLPTVPFLLRAILDSQLFCCLFKKRGLIKHQAQAKKTAGQQFGYPEASSSALLKLPAGDDRVSLEGDGGSPPACSGSKLLLLL